MNDLKLNFVIRGRDLGLTSTVGKAVGSTAALGRSIGATVAPTKAMASATDGARAATARADQAARKQDQGLGSLFRAIGRVIPPQVRLGMASMTAARELDRQARSTDKAEVPAKRFTNTLSGLFRALKNVAGLPGVGDKQEQSLERAREKARRFGADLGRFIGGAVAGGALSLIALGGSVIHTASEFERFETVLTTIDGSAAKARQSMNWIQKFSATTPYELSETTDSFVKLKAYGIDPIGGSLRTLGDGASAMGKDLMASIEMLADAQTGEFERLKEFGIRASQAGKTVRLTYSQAGKDITVVADKSASSIRKAVLGIFDNRFKGAMDRMSKTFAGMWSNLKDTWTNFQLEIARAGVFDAVKGELDGLMVKIGAMSKDGSLQRYAKEIGGALVDLFKTLKDVVSSINWPEFIRGIGTGIKTVKGISDALGGLGGIIDKVVLVGIAALAIGAGQLTGALITTAVAALGLEIALAPILGIVYLVIAAIAGLAALAFVVWRNWAPISAWFKGMWTGLTTWVSTQVGKWAIFFGKMWEGVKSAFAVGVAAVWATLPPWLKLALKGVGAVVKIGVNVVKGLSGDDKPGPKAPPPPATPGLPGTPRARAAYVRNRAQEAQAGSARTPLARPMAPPRGAIFGAGGSAPAQKPQALSGRIEIAVSQDGPPRVRSVQSNQPNLALALARGQMGTGG